MRYHLTFDAGRRWTVPVPAQDSRSAIAQAGYEFEAVLSSQPVTSATCEVRYGDEPLGHWRYDHDRAPPMRWTEKSPAG